MKSRCSRQRSLAPQANDDRVVIFFFNYFYVRTICLCMYASSRLDSVRISFLCEVALYTRTPHTDGRFFGWSGRKKRGSLGKLLCQNRGRRQWHFWFRWVNVVRVTIRWDFYVYVSKVKVSIFMEIDSLILKIVQEILLSYWTSITDICEICNYFCSS